MMTLAWMTFFTGLLGCDDRVSGLPLGHMNAKHVASNTDRSEQSRVVAESAWEAGFKEQAPDLARCRHAIAGHAGRYPTVTFEVDVASSGGVLAVRVLEEHVGAHAVACVTSTISAWSFASEVEGTWRRELTFDHTTCTIPALDWQLTTRGPFRYWTLDDRRISDSSHAANEEARHLASELLSTLDEEPIDYCRYPSLQLKVEATGLKAFAHACGRVIHAATDVERHEVAHVVATQVGAPPAFWQEGFAVYVSGSWRGEDIRTFARRTLREEPWLDATSLLDDRTFHRENTSSPRASGQAGATVDWLVRSQGKEALSSLYRAWGELPSRDPNDVLLSSTGLTMRRMDKQLRMALSD